jgi:transposase-like protein
MVARREVMKTLRFSMEQIAYALRLAYSGERVADVCRQIGVSEAAYFMWKRGHGDLGTLAGAMEHRKSLGIAV